MKNKFKMFFVFVLGLIVAGTIGVLASVAASSITYKGTTVDQALDDLYSKANALSSLTNTICTYQSEGSYGQKGEIGALYDCEVGTNIHQYFYIVTVRSKDVELIMDRNVNNSNVDWSSALSFIKNDNGLKSWDNVLKIDLPTCQQLVDFLNPSYNVYSTDYFAFGTNDKRNFSDLSEAEKQLKRNYAWLFNYTKNCYENGCEQDKSLQSGSEGYWLKEIVPNTNYAKMSAWGMITNRVVTDNSLNGVRPVITILKSQLSN